MPLQAFNKPIGVPLHRMSKESILVLRLGGKAAIEPPVRPILRSLVNHGFSAHRGAVSRVSTLELNRFTQWKEATLQDIDTIEEPKIRALSFHLAKGMRHLRDMNLVAKMADKNLGLTVMAGPVYRRGLEAALRQGFIPVSRFPVEDIRRRLQNICRLAPRVFKRQTKEWIEWADKHDTPAMFYVIPKLHKASLGFRPIAATHSYPLAKLSSFMSDCLNKEVAKVYGIAKNSKEVIVDLEQIILPDDGVFLSFDVEKMYPSMDINDTLRSMLEKVPGMRMYMGFLYKALQLLLRNSYVVAQDQVYRQTKGIATGTQMAPALANLYLDAKIAEILSDPDVLWSVRYIDDGLCYVKRCAVEKIRSRIAAISGLTFTFEMDEVRAVFLDLEIYKGRRFARDGRLDVKPYFKPTNLLLYMPWMSAHPLHMKLGVVRGEAIRLLRSSTNKEVWLNALGTVFKGLMARGYPPHLIAKTWRKVRYVQRDLYLGDTVQTDRSAQLRGHVQIQDPLQTRLSRDEDGAVTFIGVSFPERAARPYTGYGRAAKVSFHPKLRGLWRQVITRHPLSQVFVSRRGVYSKSRSAILQRWPPSMIFVNFQTVGKSMISAKQQWPGEFALQRAARNRRRLEQERQQ